MAVAARPNGSSLSGHTAHVRITNPLCQRFGVPPSGGSPRPLRDRLKAELRTLRPRSNHRISGLNWRHSYEPLEPTFAKKMKIKQLTRARPLLLAAAVFGFLAINCPFLYYALIATDVYREAMGNGLALVFIGEAFLLLAFFAVLIARMGWRKPGWIFFVVMSLLGSLAFSIPLQLYLMAKPEAGEA